MSLGVVVVESLVDTYLRYAHAAADVPLAQRERLWERLHRDAHPDVFDFVAEEHQDEGERGSVAGNELRVRCTRLAERADDLLRATGRAAATLRARGILDGAPLPVVLLAGTTRANAWVERYRGEPTLMLETTLIPDSELADIVVAHEAVHVAHQRAGGGTWPPTLAGEILSEGLATALSAELCGGHDPDVYLWIDHAHRDWLERCQADLSEGFDALRLHHDSTDRDTLLEFLNAGAAGRWPPRFGYYLGLCIVNALGARPGGLAALVHADWPTAQAAFSEATAALRTTA